MSFQFLPSSVGQGRGLHSSGSSNFADPITNINASRFRRTTLIIVSPISNVCSSVNCCPVANLSARFGARRCPGLPFTVGVAAMNTCQAQRLFKSAHLALWAATNACTSRSCASVAILARRGYGAYISRHRQLLRLSPFKMIYLPSHILPLPFRRLLPTTGLFLDYRQS
jgi:hypothetical protein